MSSNMSSSTASDGERRTTKRDVSEVDRERALLAAVRIAVGRYGMVPTADERVAIDGRGASC